MRKFVFDMETSDPDDFLTLLFLMGHPDVDLVAVTVTPGTREQVALVRQALQWFGRGDIPVGAYNIDHVGDCVSAWHYSAYPQLVKALAEPDGQGWEVLHKHLGPETTLVCGAALKNLGALLGKLAHCVDSANLGRLFVQGGFAGDGVVPAERQLEKFKGKVTCPTFNLNGDPKSALFVLEKRAWFEDLRFVSKNVCHGVKYDRAMHARFAAVSSRWFDGTRTSTAQSLIYQGMGHYLTKREEGKAFHDPLAACCAIDPEIGDWAEVELYRERGEWGSRLSPDSGVRIITGYDHERFVSTLLAA